ncbi:MAG: 50S ribosomal protein L4, partial [Chloroflexota bacterium]
MQIPVYNSRGETTELLDMSDHVFAVSFNEPLVHQAFAAQLANRRQGTAHSKTRSEVKGSTGKFFRQKGTGRA